MLGRASTMVRLGRASLIVAWMTEGRGEWRDCLAVGRTVSMMGRGVIEVEGRGRMSLMMGRVPLRGWGEGIVLMCWRVMLEGL